MPEGSGPTATEGCQGAASGLGKPQIPATTLIGYFLQASIRIKAQATEEYVEREMLGISFQDLGIALRKENTPNTNQLIDHQKITG